MFLNKRNRAAINSRYRKKLGDTFNYIFLLKLRKSIDMLRFLPTIIKYELVAFSGGMGRHVEGEECIS